MAKSKALKPRGLNIYEEKSVITAILPKDNSFTFSSLEKKLKSIKGFKLISYMPNDTYSGAIINCEYKKEKYEVELSINAFDGRTFPESYISQSYYFTNDEIQVIKSADKILAVIMKFGGDPRIDFQLQLKIIRALVPSLVGVIDDSAMKVLPPKLVKMFAESEYPMSPSDMYMVHAVYDETGNVWLHTHGLNRCGITEMEIIGANEENSKSYHSILNTFACYAIENKKEGFDPLKHSACIGWFSDKSPIVLTCLMWNEALSLYGNINMGGLEDRKGDHNGLTSLILAYDSKDNKDPLIHKITDYNNKIDNNILLFYSNSETKRMSEVAKERIEAVYTAYKDKNNEILFKIGMPIGNKSKDYEHIWFRLIEIKDGKYTCELTQEPYELKDIKVGDIREFSIKDVTDWVIYTPKGCINPNNAYILMN